MQLALVLSVGLDPPLLESRRLMLRASGYIVASASSIKEAVDLFQSGDFDLLLLCRSIPAKERSRLTCLVRASGSLIPIVSIADVDTDSSPDVFVDATVENRPAQILTGIRETLAKVAERTKLSASEIASKRNGRTENEGSAKNAP